MGTPVGPNNNVAVVEERLRKSREEAAKLQELAQEHQRQMALTQMRAEVTKGGQNLMNLIAQNMK